MSDKLVPNYLLCHNPITPSITGMIGRLCVGALDGDSRGSGAAARLAAQLIPRLLPHCEDDWITPTTHKVAICWNRVRALNIEGAVPF